MKDGLAERLRIDYIIADSLLISPEEEHHYSEKVVYLPNSYQVNDSQRPSANETPSRIEVGLPKEGFVFCCFNNNFKIGPDVFGVWMEILHAVPGGVLWLLADNPVAARNLRSHAAILEVDPERLVFAPRIPMPEHLARHRLADLFLDTLPCNAHTTASDALWAGLPVLTCTGSAFAGRVATSLLHAVGLAELVAPDMAHYRDRAIYLATHLGELQVFRQRLIDVGRSAPLFDCAKFTRHLESGYREMWRRWRQDGRTASFSVRGD